MQESIYTDLIWKAAAQIASIPIIPVAVFSKLAVGRNTDKQDQGRKTRLQNRKKNGHLNLQKAWKAIAENDYPGLQKA
jgi:hypothetical protein